MKYIELSRSEFEDIYYTLCQYIAPQNMKMTAQESNDQAIEYIRNNVNLNNAFQKIEWEGEGFRLIFRSMNHWHSDHLYRSFIVSADRNKIFYEGFINPRHIDEVRLSDNYLYFLPDEIDYLCKKYGLKRAGNE